MLIDINNNLTYEQSLQVGDMTLVDGHLYLFHLQIYPIFLYKI